MSCADRSEKSGGVVAVERGVVLTVVFTPCREVSATRGRDTHLAREVEPCPLLSLS